jgi:hypothetical protein
MHASPQTTGGAQASPSAPPPSVAASAPVSAAAEASKTMMQGLGSQLHVPLLSQMQLSPPHTLVDVE